MATIALSQELTEQLERYREQQDGAPSLDALVEEAVHAYLRARAEAAAFRPFYVRPAERGSGHNDISADQEQYLADRIVNMARGPLRITPAECGSGRSDISINHDKYLAEK